MRHIINLRKNIRRKKNIWGNCAQTLCDSITPVPPANLYNFISNTTVLIKYYCIPGKIQNRDFSQLFLEFQKKS